MTDDTAPRVLQAIQTSLQSVERKLGVMSQTLNGIRVDQHNHGEQLTRVRDDVKTIAMAVDEHGHRLAPLEEGFQAVRADLSRIMRPQ